MARYILCYEVEKVLEERHLEIELITVHHRFFKRMVTAVKGVSSDSLARMNE